MRLLKIGLLLALALGIPAQARSEARGKTGTVGVTISDTPRGVRIDYELSRPTTSFMVGTELIPGVGLRIRATEKGHALEDGRIRATAPFRHTTLQLEPDTQDLDARYPLLASVHGRGFVLYAPYIIPVSSGVVRVSIGRGRFQTIKPEQATEGFILVGAAPDQGPQFGSLASSNTPSALQGILFDRAGALLRFYERELRSPPVRRPTIVLTYSDRSPDGSRWPFRGDMTPNGFVLLRIRGSASEAVGTAAVEQYTRLLSHEIFHLWNRPSGDVPDNETWLHEGAADYFSWVAISTLWPTEISMEQQVETAARSCALFYGTRPLRRMTAADGSLRYLCGAVAQWIVDAGIRNDSAGKQDGFDLWSELVAPPRSSAGYTLEQFRALAQRRTPATASLLDDMLDEGTNWDALMSGLVKAGAEIFTAPPTASTIRFTAARSLALSACGSFGGAGEDRSGIFVTVPPSCQALGGSTLIHRVGGVDPMADPTSFYATVAGSCSRRDAIHVELIVDGVHMRRDLRCTVPVETAPPQFRVRRAFRSALPG